MEFRSLVAKVVNLLDHSFTSWVIDCGGAPEVGPVKLEPTREIIATMG